MSEAWRKKPMEQWTTADEHAFVEHLMRPVIEAMTYRVHLILKGAAQFTPPCTCGEKTANGTAENPATPGTTN